MYCREGWAGSYIDLVLITNTPLRPSHPCNCATPCIAPRNALQVVDLDLDEGETVLGARLLLWGAPGGHPPSAQNAFPPAQACYVLALLTQRRVILHDLRGGSAGSGAKR